MQRIKLVKAIREKKTALCIGLDVDLDKIPKHLHKYDNPITAFNKEIIEATHDICVSYKPNIAFYEAYGRMGWEALEETMKIIPNDIFTIADAKRGDIGNTSNRYAKAFFETYDFDAITVNPYMGEDSVTPFMGFENKWVIILGLTSNKGSQDFQYIKDEKGEELYKKVIARSATWGNENDSMFVVGATHPDELKEIRKIIPNHFLLIPGIGAQGGDLAATMQNGLNEDVGLLISSSRGIIYAGDDEDFAQKARESALKLNTEMGKFL